MAAEQGVARIGRNEQLVLEALEQASGPLSAYDILDRLRGDGLRAPLQVYRALDKLLALGEVHRLESISAFVACSHPQEHAHGAIAFSICEMCGKVEEFTDEQIADRLDLLVRHQGFRRTRTTIEIRGHCKACVSA